MENVIFNVDGVDHINNHGGNYHTNSYDYCGSTIKDKYY
jgi:hypothetical protein